MINYTLLIGAPLVVWLCIATVLAAETLNGATDACNVATAASCTGIFTKYQALMIAAVSNAAGALIAVFILNTNIAKVVGSGIVRSDAVTIETITAAMAGIIGWASFAWWRGWPISKSHSLIGAICGAAFASMGLSGLVTHGLVLVLIGFFVGPAAGFTTGYSMGILVRWLAQKEWRWVRVWLSGLDYSSIIQPGSVGRGIWITQFVSTSIVGLAHGANDATKSMGILSLVLFKAGVTQSFVVPNEVVFVCAVVMAIGTLAGGHRITERVGKRMVNGDNKPLRGVSSEWAAALIINAFTLFGIPASTTLVFVPSVAGANYASSKRDVSRSEILYFVGAWIYTFPICFFIGWGLVTILR